MFKKITSRISTIYTIAKRNSQSACETVMRVFPPTKYSVTKNGVRVSTEESRSPLICLSMIAEVGPRYETVSTNGMAHFIEHMAFKGFKTLNKHKLENELTIMGVQINMQTFREFQIFTALCLPEQVCKVIDLYAKVILEIEFSDYEMELEKRNLCLELEDGENDPKAVLFDYLHQTAFQGTPLMNRVMASPKNMKCFDKESLRSYIREHYQPYRLIIAASGNISHDSVLKCVTDSFCCLTPEYNHEIDLGPARFTGSEVRYRDDSMPFCHVAIAVEVPGYTHLDYLNLMVAKDLIGSWDKSQHNRDKPASPLARAAATSNLCESYETFYIAYRDIGLWGVYFVADKMALEDMVFNVQREWLKMTIMTIDTEVDRAVNLTKFKLARRIDGCLRSSYDIGMQLMYNCYRATLPMLYDSLSLVKPSSIRKLGDDYIYDRCPAIVAVGPTDNLLEYNRMRAGMYWLRL